MKKICSIAFSLLLVFTLTGCAAKTVKQLFPDLISPEKQIFRGELIEQKDLTGTIVGAIYEAPQDEIHIAVTQTADRLSVKTTLTYPSKAPYSEFDTIAVSKYTIYDTDGKTVFEGTASSSVEISENMESIALEYGSLTPGVYKLVISEFTGAKKADSPLAISGTWDYYVEII